jgi:hypothetical protein
MKTIKRPHLAGMSCFPSERVVKVVVDYQHQMACMKRNYIRILAEKLDNWRIFSTFVASLL